VGGLPKAAARGPTEDQIALQGRKDSHMPRGQALMKRTVKMTPEMQPVFGPGRVIKVSDLNKKLWAYIKKHKLMTGQGPLMKRSIKVTADMKPVFGAKSAIKIGEMMKLLWVYIKKHKLF
jgi:chromatin remodeling complex protein RSC6